MNISSSLTSLLIISAIVITSCSASRQTSDFSYTTPANFDSGSYINPEDYGYDLLSEPNNEVPESADPSFVPVKYNEKEAERRVNYPSTARRNGIQGKVILEVYIDSTGTVKNMGVIQSPHPLLTKPSQKAVLQTNYQPATLNGKPVNSFMRVPFIFQMMTFKQ